MDPKTGQAPVDVPPVEPVVVPPATPPTPPAPSPAAPAHSADDLTKMLADARREAADNRVKAKTAQDALDALNAEKLTAEERTTAELKKLREETLPTLEKANKQLTVQVAATALNIVDPEVASLLIDWDAVASGQTVTEALQALVLAKPYLLKAQAAPPAAVPPSQTSPAASTASSAALSYTKESLSKMSLADYEANQANVHRALREGRVSF